MLAGQNPDMLNPPATDHGTLPNLKVSFADAHVRQKSGGSGIPHSLQGLEPDGCEFLLVFDNGSFDEDSTFLISDWFKHGPPEVATTPLRQAHLRLDQNVIDALRERNDPVLRFNGNKRKEECSLLKKRTKKLLAFCVADPASVHTNEQKSFASFLQKRRPSFSNVRRQD
jgi:hypothetical protein